MADTDYRQDGATSIISMLGSIVAALGFEITDNYKAAVTMLKMQRDLMLDSTMKDYITGQYTLKTLQNIATGAWYVPGKLISWVQEWLASDKGGGYPSSDMEFTVVPSDLNNGTIVNGVPYTLNQLLNDDIIVNSNSALKFFKGQLGLRKYRDFLDTYGNWYCSFSNDEYYSFNMYEKAPNEFRINRNITRSKAYSVVYDHAYNCKSIQIQPSIGSPSNLSATGGTIYYGDKNAYHWSATGFMLGVPHIVHGGGVTRGGGAGRNHYSLPKDEKFPPCGAETTVPQINEWSSRVINWNGGCYMPLTYFKVNPSNENPGTEPGSPNTPIEPEDPRLDPESPHYDPSIPNTIIKYFYPEDYVQSTPQNGDNTVQTSGQLQDNYTNSNNGPSNIPNTDIKGGLYTLWHPSADNLQKLGAFLYGGTTQGTIAAIIGNPINAIIQLTEWAVTPVDGPIKSPVICNIGATELKMPTIPNQFMQFDCGTIEVPREYNDFRDYEPYTRLSLFLPFVGDVNISTNDCITPHRIHVIYNIDFLSGVACAEVLIDEDIRYAYQAAMCAAVPVTSSDASRLITSIIGAAVGAVGGVAMGGIVGGTAGSIMGSRALIGGATDAVMSPINGIQMQRTGSISSNTGLLGEMKPYVLVTRPISVVADQYKSLLGQPYQLDGTLGSQTGFVKVREVHLDGIMATEAEKTEIELMLKEGVIL